MRAGSGRGWLVRGAVVSAVMATLATIASLWLYVVNTRLGLAPNYLYGDAVAGVLYPAVGAYLVRRRPDNVVGWVFAATAPLGVTALANQYAVYALLGHPGELSLGQLAAWIAAWGWTPALFVPTLLPLYFPDGTLPSARWRPYVRVVLGVLAVLVLSAMVAPAPIDASAAIQNPLGVPLPAWAAPLLAVPAMICIFVLTPVALVAMVLRLRRAAGRERAQLGWLSLAVLVAGVCAAVSAALPPPWSEAAWALGSAAIPTGVVIAVGRHHLLDIQVVLNRAVVYVLLTGLLVLAYFAAVLGVGTAAGQRLGIIAVAVLALLLAFGRDRLHVLVDRLLYGQRHDPYAVVQRVGQRLDTAGGPVEALAGLTDELRSALQVPYVAVEPCTAGLETIASGEPAENVETVPVQALGEQAAVLVVGLRRGSDRFTAEERSVLRDVAQRAGALVQAAGLLEDVRRSRERIVTAREEERRRLRRDLHDGVGPQLAGLALQLDSLVSRLDDQPELAGRARALRDRIRTTVADVRHAVDDLRPPALDELGLVDALRQQFTSTASPYVAVTADGPLTALPAAVEVAAYRIVSEAVTNAIRHSGGSRCEVVLRADPEVLRIEVCDDGSGLPADAEPHVGLVSMRERAEELGGRLTVESRPGRTSITATIPLTVKP